MQLRSETDTVHLRMNNTTGTLFRQQSPTLKGFRFPTGEQALEVECGLLCFVSLPQPPPLFLLSHVTVVDLGAQGRCV